MRTIGDIDDLYLSCLSIRAVPLTEFMDGVAPRWPLTMVSVQEDALLKKLLELSQVQRNEIEGLTLQQGSVTGIQNALARTDEQLSSRAIARLAATPPPNVGSVQRRTTRWLLRPYRAPGNFPNPHTKGVRINKRSLTESVVAPGLCPWETDPGLSKCWLR